jgi:hypothetical protein
MYNRIILALLQFLRASVADYVVRGGGIDATISATSGVVSSLVVRGTTYSVKASTVIGTSSGGIHTTQVGDAVIVNQVVQVDPINNLWANVTDIFSPAAASIHWQLVVAGFNGTGTTAPISTSFAWQESSALRFWSSWDRGSYSGKPPFVDPLSPSDGHDGWWSGCYKYGSPRCSSCDMITTPLAAVIDVAADNGISLMLSPHDAPLDLWLYLDQSGSYNFQRLYHRITSANTIVLNMDLYSHAADWRGGLAWAVGAYPEFFEPINPAIFQMAGLGSYTSYFGNATDAAFKEMGYRLNWDLGGRFFPYIGMRVKTTIKIVFLPMMSTWCRYLPPVDPQTSWWNDGQGTQEHMLVNYSFISSVSRL